MSSNTNGPGSQVQGVLGLARRANALAAGTNAVLDAVRSKKALLVLAANDVSPNTEKRLKDKTSFRGVPMEVLPFGAAELGHCIGKADTAAVALLQDGFVLSYRKACGSERNTEER